MKEFTAAVLDKSGNHWMDVDDHKTDYVYGPANVVFILSHYDLLSTYVNFSSGLKRWQVQFFQHLGWTICVVPFVKDPSCSFSLYHLQFVGERCITMGAPYCASILENWTDKGFVAA